MLGLFRFISRAFFLLSSTNLAPSITLPVSHYQSQTCLPCRPAPPPHLWVQLHPSSRRRQQQHHDHRKRCFLILPFLSIPTFYPQPHNPTIIPAPTPDARHPSPNPPPAVRTMAGDHKCPVCGSTFTRSQHVARHMRSRAYTPLLVQPLPPPPITSYFQLRY